MPTRRLGAARRFGIWICRLLPTPCETSTPSFSKRMSAASTVIRPTPSSRASRSPPGIFPFQISLASCSRRCSATCSDALRTRNSLISETLNNRNWLSRGIVRRDSGNGLAGHLNSRSQKSGPSMCHADGSTVIQSDWWNGLVAIERSEIAPLIPVGNLLSSSSFKLAEILIRARPR